MRQLGLQGSVRGKSVRAAIGDKAAPCPLDRVNQDFKAPAPNRLWDEADQAGVRWTAAPPNDFTCVATWAGFVCVAVVIDAYARRIVGWRVSRTAEASFVLDAARSRRSRPEGPRRAAASFLTATAEPNIHPLHRAPRRGRHRALARYAGHASRFAVGDSYDYALAETVIGLFTTEVIRRPGPWRSLEAVEIAALEWVDRFNRRRLLEPIGTVPPAEAEMTYYAELETRAVAA